jgi:hypothetical protein
MGDRALFLSTSEDQAMNLNSWWRRIQDGRREAMRGGLWGAGIAFLVSATLIQDGLANHQGLRALGASLMMCAFLASLAQRRPDSAPVTQ